MEMSLTFLLLENVNCCHSENRNGNVRLWAVMAVSMKITAFWDIAPWVIALMMKAVCTSKSLI
jgi:hypothetical protein